MPIKTRHQRLQEAEAGAQPSPPRSLPDEPRAKRSRTNTSNARASSPQDPPIIPPSASAQTSTAVRASTTKRSAKATQRGVRGKGRARPAARAQTQTPDDAPEASNVSTQPDITADSDTSAQVDGDTTHSVEDANGETQTSRSGLEATHPVFAGTPAARLVKNAKSVSQTPRSGSKSTPSVYAPTPPPTGTEVQPRQGKRSPSETSELFRRILSSPSSPVPSSTDPAPIIETQASRPGPENAHPVLAGTPPPSLGAQPVLQGPAASPPRPVMPKVYGLPAVRDQNYSLIHILVDSLPSTTGKGLVPRQDSNIAFAIPSSEITKYLTLASQHNSEIKDLMENRPVASSFVDEHRLTDDPVIDKPPKTPLRKRKRNEEEDTPEAVARREAAAKTVGKAMRQAFVKMADERRREALAESRLHAKSAETEIPEEQLVDTRDRSDNPYTYDEVPDPREQPLQGLSADSRDPTQQEQVPETPRARRWGLSSFLPSVSRFIPFSSRRTPSAAGAPPRVTRVTPDTQAPAGSPTPNEPNPDQEFEHRQQPSGSRPGAQTEPRQRNDATNARQDGQGLATSSALAQRIHREKPQRILLTKKQAEERRKLKEEKAQLRADKERLLQEEARIAKEKKEWEEERMGATTVQVPGTKRKRLPSPETYPLPARGYGLVDAIFEYSSDEESLEEEQETPTRPRPNKKARLSLDINGDSVASEYEGGSFAGAGASSEGSYSNVFGRGEAINAGASTITPPGHSRNKFTVPSPTDSDFDEEEDEEESANAPSSELSTGTQATASTSQPTQQAQPSQATTLSPSKSMPPPPTPNPSHATLPTAPTWASLDPVEKAREKALKHQPKYGSRLRESSRLSSSTVGSEAGIEPLEDETQIDASQYDPRRPAMLPNIWPAMSPHVSPLDQAKAAFAEYQATAAKDTTTVRHRHAPWDGKGFSYDLYREKMTPRVEAHIEVTWDDDGDDVLNGLGDDQFEADFAAWKQAQGSEEAIGTGAEAAESSIATIGSDQLSYEKANISDRVRALIDGSVTKEDEEMAVNDFDEEYEAWRAEEMQKQGGFIPTIAA